MNACQSFCVALTDFLGPTLANWALMALAAVFLWLNTQKKIKAAVAPIQARAEAAEAKLEAAHVSIAKIEGSLRPAAPLPPTGYTPVVPPVIGTSSSQSGNFEPVVLPPGVPRPSSPDPSFLANPTIPRASAVPSTDDEGGK